MKSPQYIFARILIKGFNFRFDQYRMYCRLAKNDNPGAVMEIILKDGNLTYDSIYVNTDKFYYIVMGYGSVLEYLVSCGFSEPIIYKMEKFIDSTGAVLRNGILRQYNRINPMLKY